jgi:outer membrane receptor for ferrienterochelin and colicins
MGARDISDVLRRIPGFGITQGYYGKNDIEVRGIKTTNSEKIKVLIDGHSVNNVLLGSAMYSFCEMPVEGIERIEVIRGPGSALYGSNAISAVVNIITLNGQDSDGTVFSISRGSFNTTRSSLQTGTKLEDFDIAFSLNTLKSDGDSMSVESDFLGRSGKTHEPIERVDVALKLAYKDFTFSSRYAANKKGTYTGVAYALNDESEHDQSQYYVDLGYDHSFGQGTIHAKLFYERFNFKTFWEIYPEGTPDFPKGMLAEPSVSSDSKGVEIQFDYEFSNKNQFLIGASY